MRLSLFIFCFSILQAHFTFQDVYNNKQKEAFLKEHYQDEHKIFEKKFKNESLKDTLENPFGEWKYNQYALVTFLLYYLESDIHSFESKLQILITDVNVCQSVLKKNNLQTQYMISMALLVAVGSFFKYHDFDEGSYLCYFASIASLFGAITQESNLKFSSELRDHLKTLSDFQKENLGSRPPCSN